MATEYGSPELQLIISNKLLTKFFASKIGTLIPCPLNPDDGSRLMTDFVIDEIVAIRSDDTKARDAKGHPANEALQVLGSASNFSTTDNTYIAFRDGAVGDVIVTPTVFLIVSGSVKLFQADALRSGHNTDKVAPTVFSRTTPLPASLVFSARVFRTTQPTTIQSIRIRFEALWNSDPDDNDLVKPFVDALKASFPPQDIGFDLFVPIIKAVGLPEPAKPEQIVNVGVTTDLWKDSDTPPNTGLRIGIDAHGPLNKDGWANFYLGGPGLDQRIGLDSKDWAILIDGKVFVDIAQTMLAKNPPPHLDFGFIYPPTVSVNNGDITINAHVANGDIALGNAIVTLTPSAAQRQVPQTAINGSYLDVHACAHFDEDPGGAAFIVFLTTFAGAVIGGGIGLGVGALAGAIAGTVAGIGVDIGLAQVADQKLQGELASGDSFKDLELVCSALQSDRCSTCSRRLDIPVPGVGDMFLATTAWKKEAVGLAWSMRDPNLPAPAKLAVRIQDWEYGLGICKASTRDPERSIALRNEGSQPLQVCWVGQDTGQVGAVPALKVAPIVLGTRAAPSRVLMPGESMAVKATAAITGNDAYDQNNPPPLLFRVLSTAGAVEVNLNEPSAAVSQDVQAHEKQAAYGDFLCKLFQIHMLPDFWREIPFKDPVPFEDVGRVVERIDLHAATGSTIAPVLAMDVGKRALSSSIPQKGAVDVIVADERATARSHQFSQLSVARGQSAKLRSMQASAEPSAGADASRGTARFSLARTLYVARSAIPLYRGIRHAIQTGDKIVLALDDAVMVGRIRYGAIDAWRTISTPALPAVASWGDYLAVGTRSGLMLCTENMECVSRPDISAVAIAGRGHELFVADQRRISVMDMHERQLCPCYSVNLPGVTQLVSVGDTVFALAQRTVWRIHDGKPVNTDILANEILRFGDSHLVAATTGQASLLDHEGKMTMQYAKPPWLSQVLEWAGLSVEVDRRAGLLTLFSRFATEINAAEMMKRFPDLTQFMERADTQAPALSDWK